jgi:hypothetical protein
VVCACGVCVFVGGGPAGSLRSVDSRRLHGERRQAADRSEPSGHQQARGRTR